MRISDWSSDVCSSDLVWQGGRNLRASAPGSGARHLRLCQGARIELDLALMAKNSRPISSDAAAIPQCGYWAASAPIESTLEAEIGSASCRERVCQYV